MLEFLAVIWLVEGGGIDVDKVGTHRKANELGRDRAVPYLTGSLAYLRYCAS